MGIRLKIFDKKFGKDFLASVPRSPGVYFFWDDQQILLYVGKAATLRTRLGQYRRAKRGEKARALVQAASKITWEVCGTELEACLREVELIQNLRPKENIVAAYSFLYPLIGLQQQEATLRFCFTTMPQLNRDYEFYGAFRSREVTGAAFFALMRLLKFLGHPERVSQEFPVYTYLFAFRRLPPLTADQVRSFLKGSDPFLLEELFHRLLNHAGARAKAAEVKEDLRSLRTFWNEEVLPLRNAIEKTAHLAYPVAQTDRDPLFLKAAYLSS